MLKFLLKSIIKPFQDKIAPIQKIASAPLKKILELFKIITKKIQDKIKKFLDKKDGSINDYIKIRNHYVSKKLLIILTFLLITGVVCLVKILPPFLNKNIILQVASGKAEKFTGKAKLLDKNGTLIYEGAFADGKYSGSGKLYTEKKDLLYDGNFAENAFSGTGKEFYPSKRIKYDGEFKNNLYNGQGTEYYDNDKNTEKYIGDFKNGEYNGKGKLYNAQKARVYEGDFQHGLYWGEGIKFFTNDTPAYSGSFEKGLYSGDGLEYHSNGNPKYQGKFLDGKYDGEGSLSDENNALIYTGSFKAGLYSKDGKLLNAKGTEIYTGSFARGLYNGDGKLFDNNGVPLYQGKFVDGHYEGKGTLYSPTDGILYTGFFKDNEPFYPGFLSLSDAMLKEMLGDPSKDEEPEKTPASDPTQPVSAVDTQETVKDPLPAPIVNDVPITRDMLSKDLGYQTPLSTEYAYNDYSMSLVLESTSAQPKKFFVSTVKLWGMQELFGINLGMDKPAIIKNLGDPCAVGETNDKEILSMSYIIDEYLLKFYYNKSDQSMVFLEMSNALSLK